MRIRQKIDALRARTKNCAYFNSENVHGEIHLYFTNRAIQLGEASFRISDLEIPLFVLARVLCEDCIRIAWASQSDKNAAEFKKFSVSEMAKVLRVNLVGGRARLRNKSSGEDVTKTFLPDLDGFITNKKSIEQMAKDVGLRKLYDVFYRFGSMVPHATTFGLAPEESDVTPILAALSAINGFLGVIILILDGRPPTAREILETLGISKIGGT